MSFQRRRQPAPSLRSNEGIRMEQIPNEQVVPRHRFVGRVGAHNGLPHRPHDAGPTQSSHISGLPQGSQAEIRGVPVSGSNRKSRIDQIRPWYGGLEASTRRARTPQGLPDLLAWTFTRNGSRSRWRRADALVRWSTSARLPMTACDQQVARPSRASRQAAGVLL